MVAIECLMCCGGAFPPWCAHLGPDMGFFMVVASVVGAYGLLLIGLKKNGKSFAAVSNTFACLSMCSWMASKNLGLDPLVAL